jgi:UDP-N-acetylmuramoyl-tripeptide--D-alanyl-D-alanine ligase
MRIRASQIAAAVNAVDFLSSAPSESGELDARAQMLVDPVITSVGFDSRLLQPGSLFVALAAERDGHEFISAAADAGAVAILQSRPEFNDARVLSLVVPDTSKALMDLAQKMRADLSARVVALTGSVGKTSTKDMILAAIGASRKVWGNERSFNNEQGLPVTILNAPDDTEVLVLEMGMRGHGEIARLCEIAAPEIGLVTNVGYSHTERVGGIEGVAKAKGELIEALPPTGTSILNADDARVMAMRARGPDSVVSYGLANNADVRITALELDAKALARCVLETPWGSFQLTLTVPGAHMAHNAAAAMAVAGVCGANLDAAAEALRTAQISEMRMQVGRTMNGATLINDAYNANPTSMSAALRALAAIEANRRVAVVGIMAELDESERQHHEIAELAAELDIEIWAVDTDLYGCVPIAEPISDVLGLGPEDAVLIKASRVAGLDRVARAVQASVAELDPDRSS